eukprot:scaffold1665_cov183-Ochromonas_danica.AAC.2
MVVFTWIAGELFVQVVFFHPATQGSTSVEQIHKDAYYIIVNGPRAPSADVIVLPPEAQKQRRARFIQAKKYIKGYNPSLKALKKELANLDLDEQAQRATYCLHQALANGRQMEFEFVLSCGDVNGGDLHTRVFVVTARATKQPHNGPPPIGRLGGPYHKHSGITKATNIAIVLPRILPWLNRFESGDRIVIREQKTYRICPCRVQQYNSISDDHHGLVGVLEGASIINKAKGTNQILKTNKGRLRTVDVQWIPRIPCPVGWMSHPTIESALHMIDTEEGLSLLEAGLKDCVVLARPQQRQRTTTTTGRRLPLLLHLLHYSSQVSRGTGGGGGLCRDLGQHPVATQFFAFALPSMAVIVQLLPEVKILYKWLPSSSSTSPGNEPTKEEAGAGGGAAVGGGGGGGEQVLLEWTWLFLPVTNCQEDDGRKLSNKSAYYPVLTRATGRRVDLLSMRVDPFAKPSSSSSLSGASTPLSNLGSRASLLRFAPFSLQEESSTLPPPFFSFCKEGSVVVGGG